MVKTGVLLMFFLGMISCGTDSFSVKMVSFSESLNEALSLYLGEVGDRVNPDQNVLYVHINEEGEGVKLLISNNRVVNGDFENCTKLYDYISYLKGYKVYVFAASEKLLNVTKEKSKESIPDNCEDYIPVTYDGAVWEMIIKDDVVQSFDVRFMTLSQETHNQVIGLSDWYQR